jgi:hypothetical protein
VSKRVWAQPDLKWNGFEPTGYCLDMQKVANWKLTDVASVKEITVGQVFEAFAGSPDLFIEFGVRGKILSKRERGVLCASSLLLTI